MNLDPTWTYAGLDTETTGVDPHADRIVEVALIVSTPGVDPLELVAGRLRHDPPVEVPTGASDVHGITTADLETARPARDVLAETLDGLDQVADAGIPVVIYNAAFDLTILAADLDRYGLGPLPALTVVDPLVLDRHHDRYRKGKRTLTAVAAHYGVDLEGAHAAAADVTASIRVARAIIDRHPCPADRDALHIMQAAAHRTWATGFADYLARVNPDRTPPDPVWISPALLDPEPTR